MNLIDGLDGLASGFMIIICLSSIFIGQGDFSQINIYLSIILLVFLIFNQRPSKSFMGDAGSLFLGFFTAIQILLYQELYIPENSVLNITPFSIIIAFLVADTTRVFFTRILSGNNPMSADTIHLHHLVIQRSGSYLTTLFVIFFTVMTLCVFAILSIHNNYHQIGLIIHISLLLLFILTPPEPTYEELISKLIEPSYSWQKKSKIYSPKLPRTVLVSFLYIVLLFLIFSHISFEKLFHWHFLLSSILLIIFLYLSRTEKVALISLQSYQTIFLINYLWLTPINIQTKLFSVLLFISFIVFSLQRVSGTEIYKYSALDLLMLCFIVGGMILSIAGLSINVWCTPKSLASPLGEGKIIKSSS